MKSFEYAAPNSLKDAASMLASQWGQTEVLAGGTDLITSLKQGITTPSRLVSLRNIKALRGIQASKTEVRVGAMTSLGDLAKHNVVREKFPALITAIEGIGSPQILSTGTVGGDLCQRPRCWYFRNGFGLFGKQGSESLVRGGENRYHSVFETDSQALFVSASSLGPALIALGASASVSGASGATRKIPLAQFFRIPRADSEREISLQPNEIITQITIPLLGLSNATWEVRHRQGFDWPYVTASVAFQLRAGRIQRPVVVLGHVAPTPWVATGAAEILDNATPDAANFAKAADAALRGAKPLSGNAYKIPMAKTAVKRALQAAC